MLKIPEENRVRAPEASKILERDRYVDDLIHPCSSTQGAIQRIVAIEKMLNASGFKIKEWNCSSSQLRAQLNERKTSSNPDTSSDVIPEPKEDSISQTTALKPDERTDRIYTEKMESRRLEFPGIRDQIPSILKLSQTTRSSTRNASSYQTFPDCLIHWD